MIILLGNMLLDVVYLVLVLVPLLVVMTFLSVTNGMNAPFLVILHGSFVDFLVKERDVLFLFVLTCRTSRRNRNFTDFPKSYGSKRMNFDESTRKMLAGCYYFQVDDLEVFCAR